MFWPDNGHMRWRVVTWTAVAIAAAAAIGLGVVAGLRGLDKAAGLAGVIVGFCELGALVLGVAAWSAERRGAGREPDPRSSRVCDEGQAPPAPPGPPVPAAPRAGKYVISAETIEKSQVGDGNIQYNT